MRSNNTLEFGVEESPPNSNDEWSVVRLKWLEVLILPPWDNILLCSREVFIVRLLSKVEDA